MSMAYEKTKTNKKRKDGGGPSGEQGRKEIPTRVLRNKRKKVETKVETSDDDDDDDDDDGSDNSDNDDEFLRNSRQRTREFRATLARCERMQGSIAKVLELKPSTH